MKLPEQNIKTRLLDRLWRYRHGLCLLPFLLATCWFFVLEKQLPVPEYVIEVAMDAHIPFVPAFIIPYVLWYPYIALPLIYFLFKDARSYKQLCCFLASGMLIACCVFVLFPNGQTLRPSYTGGGLFGGVIDNLYKSDTPTNSLPSLHVIQTLGVHIAICRHLARAGKAKWHPLKWVSGALAVLICASTVFVKQHSIVDVIAGVGVSALLYVGVYLFPPLYCETRRQTAAHARWRRAQGA